MMGCQTTKKKHRKNLGKKRREEKRREEKRREERETFLHFFSLVSLHSFFSSLSFPLSSLSLSLINFLSPSRNQGELLLLLW